MDSVRELLNTMARLRDPARGCPWDAEQTHATLAPYAIEEAYEVDDAIRRRDWHALRDELGDLLLQVVFHAQLAREKGRFSFDDVAAAITEKLKRRHPQIFGGESTAGAEIKTAAAQVQNWEAIKSAERKSAGKNALDEVPLALPALARAAKLQRRAKREGRAPQPPPAGTGADNSAAEIGAKLFALCAEANARGVDPEAALRACNERFRAANNAPQQRGEN